MQSRELNYKMFVPELLERVPEFEPIYREHMIYFDELLPHVLLGDFTRFLFDAYRRSISGANDASKWHEVVNKSMDFMEEALSSPDSDVENLIVASFVENLQPSEEQDLEVFEALKPLLGPKLRKWQSYWDSP